MRTCALIFLVLLVGCANQQAAQDQAMADLMADCETRHPVPPAKYSENVKCLNAGILQINSETGYPFMDLVYLSNAYREALAKRMDEGALSEADANLIFAEVDVRISSEEQRRRNAAAMTAAQRQAAIGSLLTGIGTLNQSFRIQRPITCTQIGGAVTCQ